MNSIKSNSLIALTIILSFLLLFLTMDRNINIYDEGLILTSAMRTGAGDMLHRDFYANYGPAQFYILSWLFDLFGHKVIVERMFDLAIRSLVIATVYASMRKYCREAVAILITLICAFWLSALGNHGYPVYPALLLSMIATITLVSSVSQNKSSLHYVAAGLLTGFAALFRYDLGFFVYVANIFASIAVIIGLKNRLNAKPINIFNKLLIYSLATGLPVLIMLVWYWSSGALDSFIFQVISFPKEYYARTRGLPFPHSLSLLSTVVYFPIVVLTATLIVLSRRLNYLSNIKIDINKLVFLVFLILLTLAFYLKGLVRVSAEHLQLSILSSLIILGVLVDIAIINSKVWFKRIVLLLTLIGLVTSVAYLSDKFRHGSSLVIKNIPHFYTLVFNMDSNQNHHIDDNPEDYLDFFVDKNRNAANDYIAMNTSTNEKIFVGLKHHDRVFVNDISSYFLTNRLPATKWHHFDPGLQTSSYIQSAMVSDLEKNKPRYIWLESTWDSVVEPNDSAFSSGILILDKYIDANYHKVKSFGEIEIWKINQ